MSDDASLDAEINRRISRAAGTCKSLSDRCWNRSGLSMSTKLTVYKATVLPTLLYGSETWATLSIHTHRLETFHQQSLTRIMKIKWWQSISNNEVLQRAKSTTIETMLRGNRLRWLGHVSRMKNDRIPKQLLFSELARGTHDCGHPCKHWKDCAKDDLKYFNIDHNSWYRKIKDRAKWQQNVREGKAFSEQQLFSRAERRRQKQHEVRAPLCQN